MMVTPWLTALCLLLPTASSRHVNAYAGPYLIIYGRSYDCALGERGYDGSHVRHVSFSRFNPVRRYEPQAVIGNLTRSVAINDSASFELNLAIWSNNQWKANALLVRSKTRACSVLAENQPEYFRAAGGVIDNGTCLLRAGTFQFAGVKDNRRLGRLPSLPYGKYRSMTVGNMGPRVVACFYIEHEIIPDASD